MKIYIVLTVIAFFVSLFVWIYVFAQQKKDPVNATFLFFSACNFGWIGSDLLMYLPAMRGHEYAVARLCAFFWIPCGFWFLVFAYALLNKKRDWKLYVAAVSAVFGVAVVVFTDAVIIGFQTFDWGIAQIFHPIYQPLISVITAVTSAYAVLLILKKRSQSHDVSERRSLGLLIWGAVVVMGFIAVINVFLPSMLNIHTFPLIGSSAFTVFVLLVFLAVTRYRFLSISVERVAEELFEDLHEGVLLADPTGRVQRSNTSAREIFGAFPEGRDVRDLFRDQMIDADFTNSVVTISRKGAEDRCYALSASTIRRSDDVLGRIFLMRDITEQRRAESVLQRSKEELEKEVLERTKQLKHAQRMEAVGTLAGGIAHDFNNVLAVILGFANAARQDTPKTSPLYNDLEEIIVAGNRGREIVRQIMTISRKQDTSEFAAADINHIVKETLDLFRVSLPSNILLNVRYFEQPVAVRCDATQIAQVIMNLLNNAVYAMKGKRSGTLSLSIDLVEMDASGAEERGLQAGTYVLLQVGDSGCGIDDVHLSQIFNPFFTTKPQGEGTGLGLATAYIIIKNHEGDIRVESECAKGTVFAIHLPVLADKNALDYLNGIRDSDPAVPLGDDARAVILFVDDEPQVRRMGSRVLQQLGYEVKTAESGAEAIRIVKAEGPRFDLLITDYNMPGMSGIDLAVVLTDSNREIPIILMSGYGDRVNAEDIQAAGIRAFLQKPSPKKVLDETITKILEDKRNGNGAR